MKKVAVHNLGCKVNGYELDVIVQTLRAQGYEVVPFEEKADVYVINTCTVTNIADRKSRQMIHKAKHENPDAIVIAVGCYVDTDTARVEADPCVDLAIGNSRKAHVAEILNAYLQQGGSRKGQTTGPAADLLFSRQIGQDAEQEQIGQGAEQEQIDQNAYQNQFERDADQDKIDRNVDQNQTDQGVDQDIDRERAQEKEQERILESDSSKDVPREKTSQGNVRQAPTDQNCAAPLRLTAPGHTRAYIKIQDGCNQFCSYCIIPYARGRIRSRDTGEIIEEIKGLAAEGIQEVVLTGIHISSFGKDRGEAPETALLHLIERIQLIAGIRRIRLGSLEPRIMTEDFVKHLARLSKVCPHFHLSLQSGCDATLRRMNRHYTSAEYDQSVQLLRKYFDRPAITTDVIVGFAGETEEEFAQSKAFLEHVNFYEIHVFKYSLRHGTAAARMPDQQTPQTKNERSETLLSLTARQAKAYREQFLGQEEEILLEEAVTIGGQTYWTGHTTRYVIGAVPATLLRCMIPQPPRKSWEGILVRGRFVRLLEDARYVLMMPE